MKGMITIDNSKFSSISKGCFSMIFLNIEYYSKAPWMHIKLAFVLCLIIYHFISQGIYFNLLQKKPTWTSMKLRMWNEVATLLLVSIIFVVVLKDSFSWIKGVTGFLAVTILLFSGIKLYKKYRSKKKSATKRNTDNHAIG